MTTSAISLLTFDAGSISGSGRPPGEEKATHSNILAWEMPRTEELGRLQSTGSQNIRYDSATEHACMYFQIRGLRYWGGAIILTTTSKNNEWKVITQSFIHSFNKYAVHSRNCTRKDALKALVVEAQPRRLTVTLQKERVLNVFPEERRGLWKWSASLPLVFTWLSLISFSSLPTFLSPRIIIYFIKLILYI